ncbi:MAG: flavin reductase family protein [Parvibaculaceae bacterium]
MGALPAGVSVVTATARDGAPVGMTVSAVSSVSLDPPLLLVCIEKGKFTLETIKSSGSFCLNIMSRAGIELAQKFSTKIEDKFSEVDYRHEGSLGPILCETSAYAECHVHQIVPAGDHEIVIGRVLRARINNADPIIYCHGKLRGDISLSS